MAKRFLSEEEVLKRVLEDSDDEENDLAELNSSDSDSDQNNEDISPSTCDPNRVGIDNEAESEYSSDDAEDDMNESFVQAHKKRKLLTHKIAFFA